ncbi:MAG: bifunctional phosphoglucose/phosphomannose isomerase [Acidimicrobiaceae bacterium]|nr:bifunctional phosphoglucose/phosphomannose isomerase [Acidimicrobiaceae bacterium]MBO0746784.1 bifunctional phosphoglucose/phosphomannose isomerase [Acidimicrobiaceae bacterium]
MPVLDSLGMFDLVETMPEQVHAAVIASRGLTGLPAAEEVEHVVMLGMGGSGIAGDMLVAAATPLLPVPVVVSKSYELPAFIGEGSLVFAVSVSGNTEETIQAASDAAVAGAHMVVVTGGGELGLLARSWGVPIVPVPPDIPQPRAAFGAVAIPPLVVLDEIGLLKGAATWIDAAVDQLRRRRDQLAQAGDASEAAEVARRIGATIPLIQGSGGIGSAAAVRWRTQINENAKSPAFSSTQPELCHNEVCGWGTRGEITRSGFTVVQLRHDEEHPQIERRFDFTRDLLDQAVADVIEVHAEGDGELAQLLDLVLFGDYVSLWMAAAAGVDPGPVDVLVELKRRLSS